MEGNKSSQEKVLSSGSSTDSTGKNQKEDDQNCSENLSMPLTVNTEIESPEKSSPEKSPEKKGKSGETPSPKRTSPLKRQSSEPRDDSDYKAKRDKQEEERMKMQVLVSNFTENQLNRYEMYRRAAFPKASIKRFMTSLTGSAVSQNVVIAMAGIAKVFVGEVVESALDIKETWEDTGPIQPKHLREAVRKLKQQNSIPNTKYQARSLPRR